MASQDIDQDSHGLDARTRELAYDLWEQAGKPDGQDLEFWERAKQILSVEGRPEGLSQAEADVLAT